MGDLRRLTDTTRESARYASQQGRRFTARPASVFTRWMGRTTSCTVRTSAFWQNSSLITKHFILTWSHLFFTSYVRWTSMEHILLDIFPRRRNRLMVIT